MAVSTQSSDQQTQAIIEFKTRIEFSRYEIRTRFLLLFDQVKEEETRLLTEIDEIERDIIDKFNASSASLTEIILARENILGILKSNSTSTLLKNNLEMYDKEIEDITTNSALKSTKIQLNWKLDVLGTLCEINRIIDENITTTLPQHTDNAPSESMNTPKVGDHVETIRPFYQTTIQPMRGGLLNDLNDFVIDPLNAPYQPQPIDPYAGHTSQPPFPGASHYRNYPQQQTTPGSQIDMNRSWACQHCTYLNPDTNSICENCFKSPNFNLEILTEVLTARLLMAIKYCDKCYHPNRMVDVICTKCRNMIIHS